MRPRGGSRRSMGRLDRANTSFARQAILYRRFLLCAGAAAWASRRATWSSSQLRRWCSRMSTTRRLLLPRLLARLGTRALNAPGLSAYRPDAVGAVARRSLPCLQIFDGRGFGQLGAVWRASRADAGSSGLVPEGDTPSEQVFRTAAPSKSTKHASRRPFEKFQNSCVVAPVVVV